jgi:hypothetical protein
MKERIGKLDFFKIVNDCPARSHQENEMMS